jgi:hypothetical protein
LDGDLTVEHLLPQKADPNIYPFGGGRPAIWEAVTPEIYRAAMMNSVGNLTLLTQGLNSSISNGAFPDKVKDIATKSDLRLNAFLRSSDAPVVWDEDDIRARAKLLFAHACKLWPRPTTADDGLSEPVGHPAFTGAAASPDGAGGYYWRSSEASLFLPDGTDIRMKYRGEFHYARIEGNYLIFQGNRLSPHRMAGLITKTSRNAWQDLWIKRPDDSDWALADTFRPKQTAPSLTLEDLGL